MTIYKKLKRISYLEGAIHSLSFSKSLELVFKEYKLNIETVSKAAFIDKRDLYRYLGENVIPRKSNLVKLLLAMKIPYRVSLSLLYAAGLTLNSSNQDVFFSVLLENPNCISILDANDMVAEYNASEMYERDYIKPFKL